MKLVAHGSPSVLEAELLDGVATVKSGNPLAPALIVVPTRRLADHVMRRLVERFGSILGVDVLHHRALAERVLEAGGGARRPVLGDDLLATLFASVLDRAAPGPVRDFVRDLPGAAFALLDTMTDLREAGVEPAAATATLAGREAETASLYGRFSSALDELANGGRAFDEAGLARAAEAGAAAFAARYAAIWHHGAYDLIGVHVDLVRALDRGRELAFLLPADAADASGAFGTDRARALAASNTGPIGLAREAPRPRVDFTHAQGARAEIQTATYEALAAVAAGAPPHEVAIVVRSFGPFAVALDVLLDGDGPRWHTSYTRPLRRDPKASKALRAIAEGADRGARSFLEHADAFEAISGSSATDVGLGRLFQSMREIETILGDDDPVPCSRATAWLDARADAARLPPDGAEGGGVRILDAMQARGLTFAHLSLAGMNTGLFPRVAREDPFLKDSSRLLLRKETGRPLPIASEGDGEERLLLAMLLGQARERIRVSWRRADDAARPLVPSLALREVARFAKLDADAALREARALPAQPRLRLTAWAEEPGLLDRGDETLLAALASENGADAGPVVAARRPELARGVSLVAATETFAPTGGTYDGRVGRPARRGDIGVTALETLGRCPLRYYFRYVLRVEAPKTPPTPFESDAASIGTRVHDVLHAIYARLVAEGAFVEESVDARVTRARAILREAWDASAGDGETARAERLPVLSRIESQAWLRTLDAFLETDLRRLASEQLVPEALELDCVGPIPGGPKDLIVKARFDRVVRGADGRVVSDYKTGRKLKDRVQVGAMLSGEELQVPVYALSSGLPVELLGVGADPDAEVVRFARFKSDEQRIGFLETLRVVAALLDAGRFPIRPGSQCDRCDYRSACRRGHPPTEYREEHAADIRDARDCWSKTIKLVSLAAIRDEIER